MKKLPRHNRLQHSPRPFSVTLLVFGVLIITGVHLVRFKEAIAQRNILTELAPGLFPYLLISGLAWGVLLLTFVWSLWVGKSWARRGMLITTSIYGLYYWLDRLLIRRNESQNIPFWLAITFILYLFIIWALTRPKARDFFNN